MQPTDDSCKRVTGTGGVRMARPLGLLKRFRMAVPSHFCAGACCTVTSFAGTRVVTSAAEESAEKLVFRCPAPKGASDFEELTASLKRCPDTKREFVSTL